MTSRKPTTFEEFNGNVSVEDAQLVVHPPDLQPSDTLYEDDCSSATSSITPTGSPDSSATSRFTSIDERESFSASSPSNRTTKSNGSDRSTYSQPSVSNTRPQSPDPSACSSGGKDEECNVLHTTPGRDDWNHLRHLFPVASFEAQFDGSRENRRSRAPHGSRSRSRSSWHSNASIGTRRFCASLSRLSRRCSTYGEKISRHSRSAGKNFASTLMSKVTNMTVRRMDRKEKKRKEKAWKKEDQKIWGSHAGG